MNDYHLKDFVFQIIMSRIRGENHCKALFQVKKVKKIIDLITSVFKNEPIHLTLGGDFVIVGDIHGDIDTLLRIFHRFDYPPKTNYLFLGDYVDRGNYSLEVLIFLFSLKLLYPSNICMLRGNHESKRTAKQYGFKTDCISFIDHKAYLKFLKCFSYMPLTAEINHVFFCVHGGISQASFSISDIEAMKRPIVHFKKQLFTDLLWSDPLDSLDTFAESDRGIGHFFGSEALAQFLEDNNYKLLIRAHEYNINGYCYSFSEKSCLTIFSTCDYLGNGNDSSVGVVNGQEITVEIFKNEKQSRHILPQWLLSVEEKAARKSIDEEFVITNETTPDCVI